MRAFGFRVVELVYVLVYLDCISEVTFDAWLMIWQWSVS